MSCSNKKSAFTLVELLVVIVIIGILTGLLLTVIDPIRQRERAQDGTIISTANKIVAAVTAYDSAVGVYPSCVVLAGGSDPEIKNAVITDACTAEEGSFSINGITTPFLCSGADAYSAAGTAECMFKYAAAADGSTACLGARLHRDADLDGNGSMSGYFLWDSTAGSIVDEGSPSCGS